MSFYPDMIIVVLCMLCVVLRSLTQIQPLAQGAQPPQHGQLQLVGQRVRVDGSGLGADRSLPHQRGVQLGQNLFGHPPPQEVPACLTQRAQHLAEKERERDAACKVRTCAESC